jgi:uncharacterized C2H2 Zn-finger protein
MYLQTHMGGKPYQCGECDLSFALFGEFKVHVNEAHTFTIRRTVGVQTASRCS